MKKILSFTLLLGVLCLAGCKEDSQNVEFTVKEFRINQKAQTFDVSITADCQWVIEDSDGFLSASITFGEGNSIITVTAWRNETFDERKNTLVIRSEDGSCVDHLTVYQESNIGTLLENPKPVNAEGGTFQIKVKSNDDIVSVDTPDWVTFTSSRSLTDYTYTFTAEPNKTGSVRKGGVFFVGKNSFTTTEISQESFVPTGVKLTNAPSKTDKKVLTIPCKLEPEYADWSHISVKASDGCTAKMDGHHISLSMSNFGEYTYSVYSKGEELLTKTIVYMPEKLLPKGFRTEYIIGGKIELPLQYNIPDVEITSSNPDVISISNGNVMNMLSEGVSTITISAPSINHSESIDIIVVKVYVNYP